MKDVKEYQDEALKTNSCDYDAIAERLFDNNTIDVLHAAIGVSTEAGEILDVVKKHLYYGKKLDKVNLIEEAGDVMWYLSVLLKASGSTFEEAMTKNIKKLKKRYADQSFTETRALNRDLGAERQILEQGR